MPKSDKPLPSLDDLQRKIDEAKAEGEGQSGKAASGANMAMKLATDLFSGAAVGCFLGYFADRAFGTSPVLLIVFFFIGFAAGLRNMMRNISKVE